MKRASTYLFFFCLAAALIFGQTPPPHRTVLPLAPADLLKLLPAVPKGWETKESKAKSFYNESLASQANRQFVGPVPPISSSNGSASPAPPPMTRVRLTDTAYNPAMFADFDQFKPGKYGNTESLYFDSLPARRITLSDGERLRILLKGRFVAEVEVHNQQPDSILAWARLFDFARIAAAPDSQVATLPNPVTVTSIDELNPASNSSYQVSWSTQQDLDAARNRKPANR